MKKVLIATDIHALLGWENTFLGRTDVKVFVAATSDEILQVHRAERVDLILTRLGLPGMATAGLCGLIREAAALRTVSMIITCANTPEAIKESSRCGANAVLLEPVQPVLLMAKAHQFLDIAARESIRVLLSTNVDVRSGGSSFYGRTRNISATGMMIETVKRLADGSRLSCQFYLPDATSVQVTGKVVRIIQQTAGDADLQYGLMFTDLNAESAQLLADFVDSQSRSPGTARS